MTNSAPEAQKPKLARNGSAIRSLPAKMKRHPAVVWFLSIVPVVALVWAVINTFYSQRLSEYKEKADSAAERIRHLEGGLNLRPTTDATPSSANDNSASHSLVDSGEPLHLKKGQTMFLSHGRWRLVLDQVYTGLGNAVCILFVGEKSLTLDLTSP